MRLLWVGGWVYFRCCRLPQLSAEQRRAAGDINEGEMSRSDAICEQEKEGKQELESRNYYAFEGPFAL